ncbi:MAG: class A beta-lactamase [Rhodanobacteraceae bacterium]
MNRRDWLKGTAIAAAALLIRPAFAEANHVSAKFAGLERKHGGRLGAAVLDTGSGARVAWRGDERFLICSTFKLLLAAAVLVRVDNGTERLDKRIAFGKRALLEYAPVAKQHVGPPGMTIAQLCEAAVTLSDSTAANLLLANIGGPAALTRFARSLGDRHTLLDRIEPELNPYDTTTPNAMLGDMHKLLLGDVLSASSRENLTQWMLDCKTGLQSLRAGLPESWRVGDKTGQWDGDGVGANNDIAIAWPPHRKPLLIAAYYENANADAAARKAVLAAVGGIVEGL